jgi:hypothetical protein
MCKMEKGVVQGVEMSSPKLSPSGQLTQKNNVNVIMSFGDS